MQRPAACILLEDPRRTSRFKEGHCIDIQTRTCKSLLAPNSPTTASVPIADTSSYARATLRLSQTITTSGEDKVRSQFSNSIQTVCCKSCLSSRILQARLPRSSSCNGHAWQSKMCPGKWGPFPGSRNGPPHRVPHSGVPGGRAHLLKLKLGPESGRAIHQVENTTSVANVCRMTLTSRTQATTSVLPTIGHSYRLSKLTISVQHRAKTMKRKRTHAAILTACKFAQYAGCAHEASEAKKCL